MHRDAQKHESFLFIMKNICINHGRIIKWTQHISFLKLAGMAPVLEGNHGYDSKRKVARILCLFSLAKFDYSLHFYFYERKQNK